MRAFAVLPVVLFHAHVSGFGGGYVGVDIFLVISGYLITGILHRDLSAGRYSLARFYERRVRRIFPALFAVLAIALGIAAVLQFPAEFSNTGTSLVATALFAANYHFMGDTGYFATAAHGKPLLHMWSLAVEEQYYLVFPLLLAAAWRRLRAGTLVLLSALTLASLVYAQWLVLRSPDAAYYSAPARAWELMVGSLLATASHLGKLPRLAPRTAEAAAALGLAGMVLPVAIYDEATRFPGLAALPPVAGAALLLWATSTGGSGVAALLRATPLRHVGLISFSLYLWHWPVLSFHRIWSGYPPDAPMVVALLGLTWAASYASWRWVEQPFRRAAVGRQRVLVVGAACVVGGTLAGLAVRAADGWPRRFDTHTLDMLAVTRDAPVLHRCEDYGVKHRRCRLGAPQAEPTFVLWGDSHAEAISPALDAAAKSGGQAGWLLIRGGCPPLLGLDQVREGFDDCSRSARWAVDWLHRQAGLRQVVLAGRWALYASGVRYLREPGPPVPIRDGEQPGDNGAVFDRSITRTAAALQGLPVWWVSQVPEAELGVAEALARARHLGRSLDVDVRTSDYQSRQQRAEAALAHVADGARRLRPEALLCDGDRCRVQSGGWPTYRDSNHLSATAAAALAPAFEPLLRTAPVASPDPPTRR